MKPFRTVVLLLLLLLAGVLASQWMASTDRDLGEVFVRFAGYDLHTNVPRALLSLLLVGGAAWLLWRLLTLPFRAWGRHRRKQARARLIDGLDALHAGHWQKAEKLLERAADDDEVGAIARVAAVRAAQARGDDAAVQRHLIALRERSAQAHAVTAAQIALDEGQPQDALVLLDAAGVQPLPPRGLALRTEALAGTARAGEAYGLLGALKQQQALAPAAFDAMEIRLAAQSLHEATDPNVLAERWEMLTKPLRLQADVVAAYAERAAALRWEDAATRSIEQALESRWDESLVALYGRLPVGKLDSRRASAQHWLQAHPASPALLVTLGRLARLQGQWTTSQDFLHRAVAQGAGVEAWEELGTGFDEAGDAASAQQCRANAVKALRGEPPARLSGRDIKQAIRDEAVIEERDAHGLPRLKD
ncbi:HemY protein [Pseudoxanthomonas japonensis]|uniref:heme biosynthesis HemY N-terminal domain-containing protein n=1 Tax=Pseudoxanthomonas japonensis TaxID=69284 RepID=UPI001A4F745D|nr:heme biosynthesis HemY N-terminal domain-containing protein [Pseudoxanthomonas japonensis]MBL8257860.1 heme biosynthesis protein HemY [Pseudoxanthomonas mexicana]MDR7068549.1 HemY protein [Pseudoxanthomonas japonensis]